MKLYYLKGSCSFVPHVALNWANADFEGVKVSREIVKSAEYLEKNPLGQVPLLEDDGFFLTENVAILTYIQSQYPDTQLFAANDAKSRALVYKWLAFFNSDMHPIFGRIFGVANFSDDKKAQEEIKAKAVTAILEKFDIADKHLQSREYLVDKKSVADIYLYVLMRWSKILSIDLSQFSALAALYNKIDKDENVVKADADEALN